MVMRQGLALARPARRVGAAVCGVLAAIEAGWVIQDIGVVGGRGLWQVWAGLAVPLGGAPLNTSVVDAALIGLYIGAAVAAFRAVAAGAFIAVGVVTLALRAPAVLILGGQWDGALDIRGRLVLTAGGEVLGAVVLLATVVRGRRMMPGREPSPPKPAAGVLAGLLLLVVAGMMGTWQFSRMAGLDGGAQPPGFFWRTVTGGYLVNSLLGTPFGWLGWATTGLATAAAVTAMARMPWARPMGIAVGWLLVPLAVPMLAAAKPTALTVGQFGAAFAVAAAVVVTLLLLPRAQGPFGWRSEEGFDPDEFGGPQTLTMPAYGRTYLDPVEPPAQGPPLQGPPSRAAGYFGQW
jgi:hypothetical protein